MKLITLQDLISEISTSELIELSDLEGKFTMDERVIEDANSDAVSFIASYILLPQSPTRLLKDICVDLTIVELKKRQNFPKASFEEKIKRAEELLLKMANKKLPIEEQRQDIDKPIIIQRAFKKNNTKTDWSKING
ncbi:Mu-like prophage protein gp36 [Campylobacter hyointestinalis subsp. hyointestinalis]|uniref:Mu-like prophage protein gp36 n=1 Tax=Campylobacter hyointestinalis subsp. hyointestinalis TaxID=91352 RepID=A0A9W5ART9_CAMHY|nr:phage protein Gp36 family protein [Campylobacter hyointestinalis]ANE33746.1 putative protein (DUF1320 domain) [Campylobacter hyointestinalis subsp. lawsonii CCUG 27631]CUU77150.1 Mu-like prophage protein gp36 [Campylobacter hyointestinalis subsp. hyointestinalis]CUU80547.1 Mu-like prophage protein gp36 [Campylobacter hyointestinalis subsp. hyointestinalis]